jgi:uncharacterized protein
MKEKVCIAGGSGLIGLHLAEMMQGQYDVYILSRSSKIRHNNITFLQWDPANGKIDPKALECDHLINLAGAGIADKRWSDTRKKELIASRVQSNEILSDASLKLQKRWKSITCASAVGYYGDRGNETLDEDAQVGKGFMAECCEAWEVSSKALSTFTDHFSIVRIGVVLSIKDGALPKMLMTRYFGFISYFGDGSQYFPWIHIDDVCKIFINLTQQKLSSGIYNGVSPTPITNKNATKEIVKILPTTMFAIPAPSIILKLILGEMSAVVLNSNKVSPNALTKQNFQWNFNDIDYAVLDVVTRRV